MLTRVIAQRCLFSRLWLCTLVRYAGKTVFCIEVDCILLYCAPLVYKFGSEAQKSELLPQLGSGKLIGCFGLTEPNAGSNPSGLETVALPQPGGDYILNGSKMWFVIFPGG